MTERNEQTSPDIASFAAKVMRMDNAELMRQAFHVPDQFRSMAASLVTQSADRDPVEELVLIDTTGLWMTDEAAHAEVVQTKARKTRASRPGK